MSMRKDAGSLSRTSRASSSSLLRAERAARRPGFLPGVALGAICLLLDASLASAAEPHWFRDAALSPDGRQVAFRSNGDLYVAVVRTGETRLLRGTAAHETRPVWLPDGETIAFAADDHGSYDAFTIAADGIGEARRLTWHGRHEIPVGAAPDGRSLLVRSGRLDLSAGLDTYPFQLDGDEDSSWPHEWVGILAVPLTGGMPRPLIAPASPDAAWDTAGEQLVFSVRPGTDNVHRKHERSPGTTDVWLRERDGRSFRQLTTFDGHDAAPVWNASDGRIYFLSERSGSFNVWRMPVTGDAQAEQITHHTRHPVRGLSIASSGEIAYSFRGDIFVGKPGAAIARVPVRLPARNANESIRNLDLSASIHEAVIAPATAEAIVIARGEVYAIDRATSRRRSLFARYDGVKSSPTLSADGRRLLVVQDLGTESRLLLAELPESARSWTETPPSSETTFARTPELIQRAALSPDGTQAVFTSGNALKLAQVAGGAVRILAKHADGMVKADQPLSWHPAGRHVAVEWSNLQRRELEIAVVDTTDGAVLNVSRSGFADTAPRWSSDGRALLWISNRDGLRHFSDEAGSTDVYALFFEPADRAVFERGERSAGPIGTERFMQRLAILRDDPSRLRDLRVRLTDTSARNLVVALTPDRTGLLQLQSASEDAELWRTPWPGGASERIADRVERAQDGDRFDSIDSIEITNDGQSALVLEHGVARWVDLRTRRSAAIELRDVPARDTAAEQRWVFDHVARQVERLYYRPDFLRAGNWRGYVSDYRRAASAVTHPIDFAELMNELLGELDASHTSFEYKRPPRARPADSLGLIYDPLHVGPGLGLAEILPASPLTATPHEIRAGEVILKIDGKPIDAGTDPARLLTGRAATPIELTIRSRDGTERSAQVTPVSGERESELFYRRWVQWRREETTRLSQGRLGYAHLPWMEEDTFRQLVDEVLGELAGKQGIVLDLRFNQGGWLHGPLLDFLSARFAFVLATHGTIVASEPALRAGRPLVVLVNRANYSNGYEVPRLLREQNLARLVGEPVPGTGLGGAGNVLAYSEYSYAIAHDVSLTADGEPWEGAALSPDVLVHADRAAERDVQLEAAVRTLLEQLDRATVNVETQ